MDGNNVSYRQNKSQGCCRRHAVTILFCCGLILLTAGVICAITNVFEEWVKDEIRDVSIKSSWYSRQSDFVTEEFQRSKLRSGLWSQKQKVI